MKLQFLKISSKKYYLKVIIYNNLQLLQCHFLSDGFFFKIISLKVYLKNFEQIKEETNKEELTHFSVLKTYFLD